MATLWNIYWYCPHSTDKELKHRGYIVTHLVSGGLGDKRKQQTQNSFPSLLRCIASQFPLLAGSLISLSYFLESLHHLTMRKEEHHVFLFPKSKGGNVFYHKRSYVRKVNSSCDDIALLLSNHLKPGGGSWEEVGWWLMAVSWVLLPLVKPWRMCLTLFRIWGT